MDLRGQNVSDADIREMRFISNTRTPRACDSDAPRTPKGGDTESSQPADSPRATYDRRSFDRKSDSNFVRQAEIGIQSMHSDESLRVETREMQHVNTRLNQLSRADFTQRLNDLMATQDISEAQVGIISGTQARLC